MGDDQKTILVVDDSPDETDYLTTVLRDNGFATLSAEDGNEALAKVAVSPPDLITLDMSMPEKSGVSTYRALKEDERYSKIPVIIITGVSADFEQFISTRRQIPPPDGYIAKPVDQKEFLKKVRELLSL